MNDDEQFFKRVIKILGFGAAFASIPLLAAFAHLQPPWPAAVSYISAAMILIGALLARTFGEDMSKRGRQRLLLLACALTVAGLFLYLYLYAMIVVPVPGNERRILGFVCNDDTQLLYAALCPHLTELELSRASYDPALLFTPGSLTLARLLLLAAWILFTAGLVAAVAWAIVGPKPPQPPPLNDPSNQHA